MLFFIDVLLAFSTKYIVRYVKLVYNNFIFSIGNYSEPL